MYKKCYAEYAGKNQYKIHLWEENNYNIIPYRVPAYVECKENEAEYQGLKGEWLKKTYKWDKDNPQLHFHDMPAYQKFLIEKYGVDDNISKGHREVFFDIEIEMGGALTEEYIQEAPKPVTSIAWYDRTPDEWVILILDKKGQIKHTKGHKEIIPCATEEELLATFIEKFREINPDILVGWNSDYFDIPYLYFRISRVLGEDFANALSPIDVVKDESQWNRNGWLNIAGVESLDYMKLHKKFSFRDEPSMRLDAIGEKYVNLGKVEYDGNLDRLFEDDIQKFIQYNFRDVEILKELGILNLMAVIFVLNLPTVCLVLYLHMQQNKRFISREEYNKDIKNLYRETLEPLKDEIINLNGLMQNLTEVLTDHKVAIAVQEQKIDSLK